MTLENIELPSDNYRPSKSYTYPEGMQIHYWLILDSQPYEKDSDNGGYRPASPKTTYRFSKCQCQLCGNTFFVARQNLVKGLSRSCHGCSYGNRKRSIKVINLETGVEYPNIVSAAKSVGINSSIFSSKLRRGMTIKGIRFEKVKQD